MATTFFFISKIAWFLVKPLHSLVFCLLAWLGCRRLGRVGSARFFLALLLLYGGAILLTPLPELAVRSLENRFPVPQDGRSRRARQPAVQPGKPSGGARRYSRPDRKTGGQGQSESVSVDLGGLSNIKKKNKLRHILKE